MHYEQQFTITLNQRDANALHAGLSIMFRHLGDTSNAHPNSTIGRCEALLEELNKAMLGNKNTTLVSYTMVPKEGK